MSEFSLPLRLLLCSPEPEGARLLLGRFRDGGFNVEVEHHHTADDLPDLTGFDLAALDSRWSHLLEKLQEQAPELPVVALHDGPAERELHLRWLRDGALECLFGKDAAGLAAVAYRALHARRVAELRRRQEAPVVDSRELIRAVVRACPYGIVGLDTEHNVMLWSGAIESITGWTQHEVLGHPFPALSNLESAYLMKGLADHPFQEAEFGWRRKSGESYVARVRCANLHDTAQTRQGTVLVIADVTNRFDCYAQVLSTRAESDVALRFQKLLEAAPDAVLEVDHRGLIVLANASCERLLGYTPEELIGQNVDLLVPSKLRGGHHKHREAYGAAPSVRPMGTGLALKALRKDGCEIPVEITLSPIRLEGKVHSAVAIRDMSETQRIMQALRESVDQSRALFNASPTPCWVYDVETLRFLDVNDQATATYGYTRDEFLAMTVLDIRPAEDAGRIRELLAANSEEGATNAWRHTAKDGTVLDVEVRSHPLVYAGRAARLVVVHNVTERRRFEEALQEAKSRAESASRAKSEFLASMSHELRSPLHTVIGFSELLAEELEGPLNDKQKRFVQHIHKDSHHLLTLINDILDLSKIEAGRLEFHVEPISLNQLVEESIATMVPQAAAKNIEVTSLLQRDFEICGDAVRVRQVLLNLLTNAVKFTPPGGRIRVDAQRLGSQIATSVIDSGIGVPPQHRETIFDVFYQVSATTKGVREGTGLGLAICRRLVEQQGGRIWMEGEAGGGSRFIFTLPANVPTAEPALRERRLVLTLEDDAAAAELIREYLEPDGYDIVSVSSVREMLVEALERRPDVVLVDLLLPGASGWDALRALKSLRETQNIPVIIVSVVADETALKLGASAYLTKPVRRDTLVAMLRQVIKS